MAVATEVLRHGHNLLSPPLARDIEVATLRFMPLYDKLVGPAHYPPIRKLLQGAEQRGELRSPILLPGDGTAHNTITIAKARTNRYSDEGRIEGIQRPDVIIYTDVFDAVIQIGRRNILDQLATALEMKMSMNGTVYDHIKIVEQGNHIDLEYKNKILLRIYILKKDARKIDEILGELELEDVKTVVASFIHYWIPGMDGKTEMIQNMSKVLPAGGRVLRLEEDGLVLSSDASGKVDELPPLIRKAVSIIGLYEMDQLYTRLGFALGGATAEQVGTIIEEHRICCRPYIKTASGVYAPDDRIVGLDGNQLPSK